jgi:hypothetical protein
MSFLKNRIGLDLSYYNTRTVDQILPVVVSTSTGYDSKYLNAGTVKNKGFEIALNGMPIQKRNFSWNVNANWSRNRNKVVELFEGADNLEIGSFQGGVTLNATKGQPFGTIRGSNFIYTNGIKTVDADGYYLVSETSNDVIGNANPDWVGGINNSFKYKDFFLSFLVDVRKGGDIFSLDLSYGLDEGLYEETAGKNDLGNPSRNDVSQGGGIILPGVFEDGKPNNARINNEYGVYGGTLTPAAGFVYDASYVKLREVIIGYSVPKNVVSKLKAFKGIDFSLIGRNLWIIYKNLPYADPEESLGSGNLQGFQVGAYPSVRTLAFNIKLKF